MQNYLIFRLSGPMASWGDIAIGETRPSHRYPTKSAVLGLVAAAFGITRNEEEKLQILQNEIGFAVRVDEEGQLILDYHTTQVPSRADLKNRPHATRRDELLAPLNTILSTREYYCDAQYSIVLWQRNNAVQFSLSNIEQALSLPAFVLYLGRKSCPLGLPIKPINVSAATIEQALKIADETFILLEKKIGYPQKDKIRSLHWDTDGNTENDTNYKDRRIRKDKLKNRQRWQYQDREEYYKIIPGRGEQ